MSTLRKRSAQHKVHIPATARENQYLMAKFSLTDELLEKFSDKVDADSDQPYLAFYQHLSEEFFDTCHAFGLESGQFVANDKFPRVRYSPERMTSQTNQQILFLYNPRYHSYQNAHFDGGKRSKSITLVFLAQGKEVRGNAAKFHQMVTEAMGQYSQKVGLPAGTVRLRDHQHLTYELFAKDKGVTESQAHKFRAIANRYLADDVELPADSGGMTYAVADMPVNRRMMELAGVDRKADNPYSPLYQLVDAAFIKAAKDNHLNNGALLANGLVPIVRNGENVSATDNGELQMLAFNTSEESSGYVCKWDGNKLVDTISLVFVASKHNQTSHGYGKFASQIERALRSIAKELDYVYPDEEMMIHFHQHIGRDV